MIKNICYKCEKELTSENRSDEHIIQNACGGRLKSSMLLCMSCNSSFGFSADKALAKSTSELANFLMIERDRGEPQRMVGSSTVTGERYYLEVGGTPVKAKPTITETKNGNRVNLKITASNEQQYKTIAEGYVRKYPQLKIEDFYRDRKIEDVYLTEPINIQLHLGGRDVFRAVTKTAINYFIFKGGDRKHIVHLLSYIEGTEDLDMVWLHYPRTPIYNHSDGEVSHIVHIVGDPEEKILYAYVELFNCQNYIVKLSTTYDGPKIIENYGYDLLKRQEFSVTIEKQYNKTELFCLFDDKDFVDKGPEPFKIAQDRLSRVTQIADRRLVSLQISRITKKILTAAFKLYPKGTEDKVEREVYIKKEADKEAKKFAEARIKGNLTNK